MEIDLNIYDSGLSEDVGYVINKAEEKSKFDALCLGDSVCRQFFSPYMKERYFCHLASIEAITPCGQYLLLYRYLENNPQTKTVYLYCRPSSFSNEFRTDYTYQYFICPFFDDNRELIDTTTVKNFTISLAGCLWKIST